MITLTDPTRVYVDWEYGKKAGVWEIARAAWDHLDVDAREVLLNEMLIEEIRKSVPADYKVRPLPPVPDVDEEERLPAEGTRPEEHSGAVGRGETVEQPDALPATRRKRGKKPAEVPTHEGS